MKIIMIAETDTARTIEICIADECAADEQHISLYHRSWTWSTTPTVIERSDGTREEFVMTLEQCVRESLLLAREERKRMFALPGKELSKTKLTSLNKKFAELLK